MKNRLFNLVIIFIVVCFIGASSAVIAQECAAGCSCNNLSSCKCKHEGHCHFEYGPIGVMGDHTHPANEIMFSYRYMTMFMEGNRNGTDRINKRDVFADGYMVSPTSMTMDMHMLGAMYSVTDDLTIMAMVPCLKKSMNHVTKMGAKFTTKSQGVGDIRLSGLFKLFEQNGHHVHINAGLGIPTGKIDEKDDTPAGSNKKLPYPMQLGSGTCDLLPGLTYLYQSGQYSLGVQGVGTLRLGRNSEDYSLGDRFELSVWGQKKLTDCLSTSLRVNSQMWGKINGDDDDLAPAMVPTANTTNSGGEQIDLLVGLSLNPVEGWAKGHRLAVEFGVPVYQSLNGPGLETDWLLAVGWQYAW